MRQDPSNACNDFLLLYRLCTSFRQFWHWLLCAIITEDTSTAVVRSEPTEKKHPSIPCVSARTCTASTGLLRLQCLHKSVLNHWKHYCYCCFNRSVGSTLTTFKLRSFTFTLKFQIYLHIRPFSRQYPHTSSFLDFSSKEWQPTMNAFKNALKQTLYFTLVLLTQVNLRTKL